ncbi:cytochrome P450 [Hysterangium stoloniferum]|nr:cytochrome P450 [Hysterangium stoloniferum]
MNSLYLFSLSGLVAALVLLYLFRARSTVAGVGQLQGPRSPSWLVGNLHSFFCVENVGDDDFNWLKTYGPSMSIKGPFGRDVLYTADPRVASPVASPSAQPDVFSLWQALQYILNTSGYRFPKSPDFLFVVEVVAGRGIIWAEGEHHILQRKIMAPGFSQGSIKGFLPMFRETAERATEKWQDLVLQDMKTSSVIDVHSWLGRLSLDIIGKSMDYEFHSLSNDSDNEVLKVYKKPTVGKYWTSVFFSKFTTLLVVAPTFITNLPIINLPSKISRAKRLRDYYKTVNRVGQTIIDRQLKSLAAGNEGGKDLMGVLVKNNCAQREEIRLGNAELLAQLSSLLLAGHETVTSVVSWILWELSKNPALQAQLREEIINTRTRAIQKGQDGLTSVDFDSMPYLLAVIKETLRFHAPLPQTFRIAGGNETIPFSTPLRTKDGGLVNEISVSKGQRIVIGLAAYNRLETVWGPDANEWKPERFLDGKSKIEKTGLGVIANLSTFSSGERNCIGWRFAMLETQVIVSELIEHFNFSPPPGNVEMIRAPTLTMNPMVKEAEGPRIGLPLTGLTLKVTQPSTIAGTLQYESVTTCILAVM